MTGETALLAVPPSALGLVLMLTCRTPATGSSFGAGEAHDVGLLAFMREVIDIASVLPERHALVVVPAAVLLTDPVGIANEQRANVLVYAEVHHFARSFVAHVSDTSLITGADGVLGMLELAPPSRMLLATCLLLGELAQTLGALSFEGANTPP